MPGSIVSSCGPSIHQPSISSTLPPCRHLSHAAACQQPTNTGRSSSIVPSYLHRYALGPSSVTPTYCRQARMVYVSITSRMPLSAHAYVCVYMSCVRAPSQAGPKSKFLSHGWIVSWILLSSPHPPVDPPSSSPLRRGEECTCVIAAQKARHVRSFRRSIAMGLEPTIPAFSPCLRPEGDALSIRPRDRHMCGQRISEHTHQHHTSVRAGHPTPKWLTSYTPHTCGHGVGTAGLRVGALRGRRQGGA